MTFPGLFDLDNMYDLHKELEVPLLLKKVFTFTPDVYMSPLWIPKKLLTKLVDKAKQKVKNERKTVFNLSYIEGLDDLLKHKCNDERYDKETCQQGWRNGKAECERIDNIRGTDIKKILAREPEVLEWWKNI